MTPLSSMSVCCCCMLKAYLKCCLGAVSLVQLRSDQALSMAGGAEAAAPNAISQKGTPNGKPSSLVRPCINGWLWLETACSGSAAWTKAALGSRAIPQQLQADDERGRGRGGGGEERERPGQKGSFLQDRTALLIK